MPTNIFTSILIVIIASVITYFLSRKNALVALKRLNLFLTKCMEEIIGFLLEVPQRYLRILDRLLLVNINIKSNSNAPKLPRIANSLPEEQKKSLCDLRRRWRSRGDSSKRVRIRTYHFLFRHWWGNSWSEIGKYVRRILPTRWI
jgi:hypothetical protein